MRGETGVASERFSLTNPEIYMLQGVWPRGGEAEVWLDHEKLPAEIEEDFRIDSSHRFEIGELSELCRIKMTIRMPSDLSGRKRLVVRAGTQAGKTVWFKIKVRDLLRKQTAPHIFFEEFSHRKGNPGEIRGWAAAAGDIRITVKDAGQNPVDAEIVRMERNDVKDMYEECTIGENPGFLIRVPEEKSGLLRVCFQSPDGEKTEMVSLRPADLCARQMKMNFRKAWGYLRRHGGFASVRKAASVISREDRPVRYCDWVRKHARTPGELEQQRKTSFPVAPKISVVVPLYRTPVSYLEEMIRSVKEQTYGNWELCLSDGSGEGSGLETVLARLQAEDSRIQYVRSEVPLNISDNTNAALKLAHGEFIALLDHDDCLAPDALYECVRALNADPGTDIFYSDEDKMSMDGRHFFEPHMKPDFNPDLLRTVNYICHLFVVRKSILEKAGLFRSEYDGAQDYDMILRCTEITGNICHIPRVLYHWRSHENSTAENPESKQYAFDAGQRALQAHFDRLGIRAEVYQGEFPGLYRTRYIREYDPLISILIPNKDHVRDLDRCIRSLEQKSTYRNYEYIIIENNSTEEETFAYYRKLEEENSRVRVIYWKGEFNYSAINNFGEKYANGDYLLLLNNDTAIINPDCLEELLGYCMREDVGAVGARLYYEDDTIQHAGVVIGFGGIAGHCFVQQRRDATGYCHRIICAQNYSAVTAACMMVKKSVYEEVGGFNEEMKVAFNDIDFCLRLGKAGYRIVYNPYAELYHFESKSRGIEDTPEKQARFRQEVETFERNWPEILKNGDPYYNPNLTLKSQDFSLRK